MTIFEGSHGSITFFYKGLLISSFPLTKKKKLQDYLYQGEDFIYNSKKISIKNLIKICFSFCNTIWRRKKNNLSIYRKDHIYFLCCVTALLRLGIIENDEYNGYLVMPKKKIDKGHNLRLKVFKDKTRYYNM